jgi:hypothetical protein
MKHHINACWFGDKTASSTGRAGTTDDFDSYARGANRKAPNWTTITCGFRFFRCNTTKKKKSPSCPVSHFGSYLWNFVVTLGKNHCSKPKRNPLWVTKTLRPETNDNASQTFLDSIDRFGWSIDRLAIRGKNKTTTPPVCPSSWCWLYGNEGYPCCPHQLRRRMVRLLYSLWRCS